jgi:OFA family oxalate/formate antiporter-like MFS transporter
MNNKWVRAAIPALLIHICIGSVYCWSLLKDEIAQMMTCDVSEIEFAFSLAIFFLGMSAAFGGNFVERNVKMSSGLSCVCFSSGLLLSVLSILTKSIPGLMVSYGCIMGVGLGIGYLSPVKTLMIWFNKHKGLATGIAISGFGLSKVLFSPFIEWCNENYSVVTTLIAISAISVICMTTAAYLIKKPHEWNEPKTKLNSKDYLNMLKAPSYWMIWLIFYLNITCGLALISFEKSIGIYAGITNIALLSALTAFFNTAGRFCYSTASDFLKNKTWIYIAIFASSALCVLTASVFPLIVPLMLCVINAGYGGGFSTLPTLLQSKFGMEKISTIHGLTLSAWAFAGLTGNQISNLIINILGWTYNSLFMILFVLYILAFYITYRILKN